MRGAWVLALALSHGVGQRVLAPTDVAASFLALTLHRLLVGKVELLNASHVHLEVALVAE